MDAQDSKTGGHTVTIKVNKQPVRIKGPRASGLEIKQAAIAAGVEIELDFVLSELHRDERPTIVGDRDMVEVTEHSAFSAVPDDDDS